MPQGVGVGVGGLVGLGVGVLVRVGVGVEADADDAEPLAWVGVDVGILVRVGVGVETDVGIKLPVCVGVGGASMGVGVVPPKRATRTLTAAPVNVSSAIATMSRPMTTSPSLINPGGILNGAIFSICVLLPSTLALW